MKEGYAYGEGVWTSNDGKYSFKGTWAADRYHGYGKCKQLFNYYSGIFIDHGQKMVGNFYEGLRHGKLTIYYQG